VRREAATIALVVALVAVGAAAWSLQLRPTLHVDASPLEALPRALDGWEAVDVPLEESVESMLRADHNVQRVYAHGLGGLVWLYVGYYGTERGGQPEHTPAVCYRAHGWNVGERRVLEIDPRRGLRVNEFVVEKGGRRELVHFWFRSYRSTGLLGGIDQTLDRLVGRLLRGRADGSLVRISTALGGDGDEAAARARLAQFAAELESALALHWPDESER
jgi:EpsI family protein